MCIKWRESDTISDHFVVITAGIGLLLSTLDTGIINVAMPSLLSVFHSTVSGVAWTVTLYTLALTGREPSRSIESRAGTGIIGAWYDVILMAHLTLE